MAKDNEFTAINLTVPDGTLARCITYGEMYLGGWRRCSGGLCDLDVLHLDGMLRVGLRIMQLANIHGGLLRVVWGSGLEGEKNRFHTGYILTEVKRDPRERSPARQNWSEALSLRPTGAM